MNVKPDRVEAIARAVLYEGYLLYPYRRSALKNRRRWNFGVLYPEDFSRTAAGAEAAEMQTECLALAEPGAALGVEVRFLHLAERGAGGEEALQRAVPMPPMELGRLVECPAPAPFRVGASAAMECSGRDAVPIRQTAVEGAVEIAAARAGEGLFKVTVRIRNTTPFAAGGREEALAAALVSTHAVLRLSGGEFVSLIDPPDSCRDAAAACRNSGLWPVLAGAPGERGCMLAAPIILYDYPEIAPESPGDFFDGTEIDELLTLRVMALTDAEKEEMRRDDARAREILERSEALPEEHRMKLHGRLRGARR